MQTHMDSYAVPYVKPCDFEILLQLSQKDDSDLCLSCTIPAYRLLLEQQCTGLMRLCRYILRMQAHASNG